MAVDFIGDGLALRSKGDIVSNDGTSDLALTVGANGQILSAQSSATSGLVWIDPTTQPTLQVEAIASSVATANVASITFSSIPSGYRDLRLIMTPKGTTTAQTTTPTNYTIKVNSSTANIYSEARYGVISSGTTIDINVAATSASYTAQMNLPTGVMPNNNGNVPYATGIAWFDFQDYSNTALFKTVTHMTCGITQDAAASGGSLEFGGWQILTTSAITSIVISGNFKVNTAAHLWGIK